MSSIKSCIFDIGGVILYWNPEELVKSVFHREYPELLAIVHSDIWKRLDEGTLMNDDACKLIPENLQKDFALFLSVFTSHMHVLDQGVEMIQYCREKGLNLYILSNFHKEGYELIRRNPVFKDFDGYMVSSHVKMNKPNDGVYNALLYKYELNPTECIFIDDKVENIEAAKKLGIHGILCETHKHAFSELKKMI